MKIELDDMAVCALARDFAARINRLAMAGRYARVGLGAPAQYEFEHVRAVRAAVQSLDKWDRVGFVAIIRFHLHSLRQELGVQPRWQDWVAQVEAQRKFQQQEAA